MRVHNEVAPEALIRQDFKVLDARETLRTTWEVEELLLAQSVLGHAHEGHGVFRGRRFPNTTQDDVTRALRLDPDAVREARQALIDGIASYADRAIRGDRPEGLCGPDGDPLLGMSTLRLISVDPADVLRGLYLGGLRDDADVRLQVERAHGIRIGAGRGYHVDFRRMRALSLSAEALARGEWGDAIERLERDGLIVGPERAEEPDVHYQFIRFRQGPGASDDAAIVAAGLMWGPGVAVGVFLADAIDTLEKYVPVFADQDERIALRIEGDFVDLRLGRPEVRDLTYLAATPEGREHDTPDSSLRHLLAVDRHVDMCPLEAHLLAVRGLPAPSIGLGHERTPSGGFYAYVRERVAGLREGRP
ncbi:MAG: hypothetical protein IT208_03110 [Chthonomonadales bacterium]|nr:hypothetical protein [Chthonomonadales bacterium]